MIIVLYDKNADCIYICRPNEKTVVVKVNDPRIMDMIPEDDILYITNGHYFTKQQFADYLSGKMTPQRNALDSVISEPSRYEGFLDDNLSQGTPAQPKQRQLQPNYKTMAPSSNRKFIHCTGNGHVLVEDISTPKFPGGVALQGKWHFIAVDEIGEDELSNSKWFEILLKKGKVEVVDEAYVQQHAHKLKNKKSPAEAALDKILIPPGPPGTASNVAASGGLQYMGGPEVDDVAIPIYIDM